MYSKEVMLALAGAVEEVVTDRGDLNLNATAEQLAEALAKRGLALYPQPFTAPPAGVDPAISDLRVVEISERHTFGRIIWVAGAPSLPLHRLARLSPRQVRITFHDGRLAEVAVSGRFFSASGGGGWAEEKVFDGDELSQVPEWIWPYLTATPELVVASRPDPSAAEV